MHLAITTTTLSPRMQINPLLSSLRNHAESANKRHSHGYYHQLSSTLSSRSLERINSPAVAALTSPAPTEYPADPPADPAAGNATTTPAISEGIPIYTAFPSYSIVFKTLSICEVAVDAVLRMAEAAKPKPAVEFAGLMPQVYTQTSSNIKTVVPSRVRSMAFLYKNYRASGIVLACCSNAGCEVCGRGRDEENTDLCCAGAGLIAGHVDVG